MTRWAIVLLLAHIALGALDSFVVPLWESYDEWGHYAYVQYVANHLRLPPPGRPLIERDDEVKQPPLYYVLAGLSTFWLQPHEPLQLHLNPYGLNDTGEGGRNAAVHGDDEAFPFHGFALGVHAVRLLTVLMSSAAVWWTFQMARLIFPNNPAIVLGATALHALAPQFLFLSAMVNNDGLAMTFASLTLYTAMRVVMRPVRIGGVIWPVLALTAGALTKFNVLTLAPLVMLAVAIGLWKLIATRQRRFPTRFIVIGVLSLAALAVMGWVYAQDVLARQAADIPIGMTLSSLAKFFVNPFAPEFGWSIMPAAFDYGFTTYWAAFGWGNVPADDGIYLALAALCWASLFGLVIGTWRDFTRAQRLALALLMGVLIVVIVPTAYFTLFVRYPYALSGRYLLISISAVSVLLVAGFAHLFPRRLHAVIALVLSMAFALWAVSVPFQTLMPVYAQPPRWPQSAIEQVPNRLQANFGDEIELVGYEIENETGRQGERLPITLYWRLLRPTPNDYTVAVHLIGRDAQPVGGIDTYPGHGNYATSLWKPAEILQDRYWVPIQSKIAEPSMGRVVIAMYLGTDVKTLTVTRPGGAPPTHALTVGKFRLMPNTLTHDAPSTPVRYRLGDEIALIGYDASSLPQPKSLQLKFYWQALKTPTNDYTLFIHLSDAADRLIAQRDEQPLHGNFPTSLWRANELIVDVTGLPIPDSLDLRQLRVWVGLYRLDTLQRLAVTDQNGRRLPDDRIPISVTE